MSEREILIGCLQSFFRNRHKTRNRFKNSKRNPQRIISVHRRYCELCRYYIRRIRALDAIDI